MALAFLVVKNKSRIEKAPLAHAAGWVPTLDCRSPVFPFGGAAGARRYFIFPFKNNVLHYCSQGMLDCGKCAVAAIGNAFDHGNGNCYHCMFRRRGSRAVKGSRL